MRDAVVIVLSASLGAAVVLSLLLVAAVRDQRAARAETAQLATRLQALEDQIAALCEATNALSREIQAARQPKLVPEPGPAQVEAKEPGAPESAPKLAPFQVPVFVGEKSLGSAWVVPTQVKRDPKTGRVTYQPVIRLPETLQTALRTYVTNVVEKPVPAPAPAAPQPAYYSPPPGYYHYYYYWRPWWLGAYAWAVRLGPDRPEVPPPAAVTAPQTRTGGPWTPVVLPAAPTGRPRGIFTPPSPGSPGIYVPPGLR